MEKRTRLPLCYSFSFDIETMTLYLKIQKWIIPFLQNFFKKDSPLMGYMHRTYKGSKILFENFGLNGKSFGWNNAIEWVNENETGITYSYMFVPAMIPTEKTCKRCHGTKIDFLDHECHDCYGTGKKYVLNNKNYSECLLSLFPIMEVVNAVLLNQSVDDNTFTFAKPETDSNQLIAIQWSDTSGMYNCSLCAWFDDAVVEWMKSVPDEEVLIVSEAMQKVEEHILQRKAHSFDFKFTFHSERQFGLHIPGNACDLCSYESLGMFGSLGKTLSPHNLDSRIQQTEFIVGLAMINDLAEKYYAQK